MKMIFGLGNPGGKYKKTRHNVGFMILDRIASKHGVDFKFEPKFKAEIAEINSGKAQKTILCKPQTFMNNSGQAVNSLMDYFKTKPEEITIIQDEIDLPFGEIKISVNSGSAGHKGIQSIIDYLQSRDFKRIRFGIKNNTAQIPTEIFVLKDFSLDEQDFIKNLDLEIFEK